MNIDASLKLRALKGAGWMISWRLLTRILGLVSTSVIARILIPADFGLVALAYALAKAIDATAFLGIDLLLLREPRFDEELYSTGFTVSLLRSAATAIVVTLLAQEAAALFNEPRLSSILYCFALGLVFEGSENLGVVEFRKTLQFKQEFILFSIPRIIAVIFSIGLAVMFESYWSIVIGSLSFKISRTGLSYILHPFRPRLTLGAWKQLCRFSVWMWIAGLATFVRDRADTFVVGRMMNTNSLGLFSAAVEIAILPVTEIVEPLSRVLFPGISAAHRNGMEVGEAVSRSIGAVSFVLLPGAIGVSLLAAPVIYAALGPSWMEGYPLVQIIAPFAVWAAFSSVISSAFVVLGNPRMVTIITVALAILRPFLLVLGLLNGGLRGVAFAIALSYLLEATLYVAALMRLQTLRVRLLIGQLWRTVISTAMMGSVVVGLGFGLAPPPEGIGAALGQLILGTVVGMGSYSGIVFTLWILSGCPDGPEALVSSLILPRLAAATRALRAPRVGI
jgi:lipopolysaccharide exporter